MSAQPQGQQASGSVPARDMGHLAPALRSSGRCATALQQRSGHRNVEPLRLKLGSKVQGRDFDPNARLSLRRGLATAPSLSGVAQRGLQ